MTIKRARATGATMIGDKTSDWAIRCGMLLAFASMASDASAGVTALSGTKRVHLCARSLLLHTSVSDPPWRSNARCPRFLGTPGFPLSAPSKRT